LDLLLSDDFVEDGESDLLMFSVLSRKIGQVCVAVFRRENKTGARTAALMPVLPRTCRETEDPQRELMRRYGNEVTELKGTI
jgi:hypothetical protein